MIGTVLGLSWYVLDTIKDGIIKYGCGPRPIPCCNAMLEKWLQIDPYASWSKLFTAIESPAVAGRFLDKGMYSSCM